MNREEIAKITKQAQKDIQAATKSDVERQAIEFTKSAQFEKLSRLILHESQMGKDYMTLTKTASTRLLKQFDRAVLERALSKDMGFTFNIYDGEIVIYWGTITEPKKTVLQKIHDFFFIPGGYA